MTDPEPLYVGMLTLWCGDAATLAGFWASVLQRPVDDGASSEFATIGFDDPGPTWLFLRADDRAAPPGRFSLDLGGEEHWRQHADRIEALGAERVTEQRDDDGAEWVRFRDPEGNEFRVFGPRPSA